MRLQTCCGFAYLSTERFREKNALFYSLCCGLLKENLEFGNWCYSRFLIFNLDNIYLFKVSGRNTKKRCEICSELTIKTPERRHWRSSGDLLLILNIFALLSTVFIIDFGNMDCNLIFLVSVCVSQLGLESHQLRRSYRKLSCFYKLFNSEHLHYLFKLIPIPFFKTIHF